MHNDQKYIIALREHHADLTAEIYSRFAPNMKAYLISKGAGEEDAGDIFQEALIDIYKLAADGKFELNCPFEAFLLIVCKRKWINLAKKNSYAGVTNTTVDVYTHIATEDTANAHADILEKETLVMQMLQKISKRCREIIMASYANNSQQQLANELNVSYAYLRKKKSLCMAELIELVNNYKM